MLLITPPPPRLNYTVMMELPLIVGYISVTMTILLGLWPQLCWVTMISWACRMSKNVCLIPCNGRRTKMQSLIRCFLGIMAALLLHKHGFSLFYNNIASFTHSTLLPGVWRLETKLTHLPLHRLGDTVEIPEDTLFFLSFNCCQGKH